MAKVTGIGGVFFLSGGKGADLAKWYATHLGLSLEEWGGAILHWKDDQAEDGGMTVWNAADADSEWFGPSKSSFMINYRVDDMAEMIAQLTSVGIEIVGGPDYEENGVFAWIMDPAGNKVELWEPKNWAEKNKR